MRSVVVNAVLVKNSLIPVTVIKWNDVNFCEAQSPHEINPT